MFIEVNVNKNTGIRRHKIATLILLKSALITTRLLLTTTILSGLVSAAIATANYRHHQDLFRPCSPMDKVNVPSANLTVQRLFSGPCACDAGWSDAFCANLERYQQPPQFGIYILERATPSAASVCVCRTLQGRAGHCNQFLVRCFARKKRETRHLHRRRNNHFESSALHSRPRRQHHHDKCSCCFNQPEEYCNQVECAGMRPQLGMDDGGTLCQCWDRPMEYPVELCNKPIKATNAPKAKSSPKKSLKSGHTGNGSIGHHQQRHLMRDENPPVHWERLQQAVKGPSTAAGIINQGGGNSAAAGRILGPHPFHYQTPPRQIKANGGRKYQQQHSVEMVPMAVAVFVVAIAGSLLIVSCLFYYVRKRDKKLRSISGIRRKRTPKTGRTRNENDAIHNNGNAKRRTMTMKTATTLNIPNASERAQICTRQLSLPSKKAAEFHEIKDCG